MQHTAPIPRSAGAAMRAWVLHGLWRGAAVGAATPIVGFALVWAVGSIHADPLPPGTITTSTLDDASFAESLSQLGGLALYASIAAGVGAPVGALVGALVGLIAGAADALTGRRLQPVVVAVGVIAAGAALASWVTVVVAPDAELGVRLVVLVPFVLGAGTLAAVPLRRTSPASRTEAGEQHLGQPGAPRDA